MGNEGEGKDERTKRGGIGLLTIIENVYVYEPEDLGLNDIVVCHGKIVEVGPGLAPAYPKA